MSKLVKTSLFWAVSIMILLSLFALFSPQSTLKEVPISSVIQRANSGEIKSLQIQGNEVSVTLKNKDKPTERSVKQEGSLQDQGLKAMHL